MHQRFNETQGGYYFVAMASILLSLASSVLSKLGLQEKNPLQYSITAHTAMNGENQNSHTPNGVKAEASPIGKGNIYSKEKSVEMRHRYICSANKLFFRQDPLKIVRGIWVVIFVRMILAQVVVVTSFAYCSIFAVTRKKGK